MAFDIQLLKELTQVETREDTTLGIMKWGQANAFPQTLKNLIDQSPAAKAAVKRTMKFYKGGKFEGEDQIINPSGQTLKDIVSLCADELANLNAFSLHCNFNLLGQVSAIQNLRIAEQRFNQFDELNSASKIGYHPNFGYNAVVKKTITNTVTRDKIKWIDRFNPSSVLKQIEETTKGISNYQGQVLYCSPEGLSSYPIPTLQAPINYVLADIENSILVRKETSTGFINTYLLKTMLSNDNPNLIALENAIIDSQGARGAGKVITLSGLSQEEMSSTVLEPIMSGNGSGDIMDNCVVTNDLAHKVINGAYLIPPLLSGAAESSGFSTDELRDSYFIFNAITQEGRDYIEFNINRVLKHSNFPIKQIKLSQLTLDETTTDETTSAAPIPAAIVMGGPGSGRREEGGSKDEKVVSDTPKSVGTIVEDSKGVQTTSDVNEVEMSHFTDASNIESIKENGFNTSTNSMYGEGVYFSNKTVTGEGRGASIKVSVEPHNQLYVDKDFDINKIVSNATGKDITNSFQTRNALLDAGYKSMRINMDDGEVYTVILDPSIIKIEK